MRIIKIQVRVKYGRYKLIISIFVLFTLFENRDAKSDERWQEEIMLNQLYNYIL